MPIAFRPYILDGDVVTCLRCGVIFMMAFLQICCLKKF